MKTKQFLIKGTSLYSYNGKSKEFMKFTHKLKQDDYNTFIDHFRRFTKMIGSYPVISRPEDIDPMEFDLKENYHIKFFLDQRCIDDHAGKIIATVVEVREKTNDVNRVHKYL